MSRPHWHTKRDANQTQIITDLRACGFTVYDISTVPDSQCPGDILVHGFHQRAKAELWQPFEVKREDGQASNALQKENAEAGHIPIVRVAEDVLAWYGRV